MHMVLVGEPTVKLHVKNVKAGTSANGNPRQDQLTMGRVDSLLTTKGFVLLNQYHVPVIVTHLNPIQVLLREAETAGLSAGLRTTASNVESSA